MAFVEGARLLRRPTHHASATLSARATRNASETLSAVYTGDRDDLDFTDPSNVAGSRVVVPSHTTFDASATYHLSPGRNDASILVRVSNLFDTKFEDVFNFPAARRLIWIGGSFELHR